MKYHQIIYIVTVQVNEAKYPVLGFWGAGAVRRGSLSLSPEVAAALGRVAGRRTDGQSRVAQQDQGSSRTQQAGPPLRGSCLGLGSAPGSPHGGSSPRHWGGAGASSPEPAPLSRAHRSPRWSQGALWEPQAPRRVAGWGRPGGRGGTAAPAPCVAEPPLRSAPLGSAGAGGVAVCREDFVGDPAALPLVRPLLGPQV